VLTDRKGVQGVTSLGSEVFVVRDDRKRVEVYDSRTMTQKNTIQVPGLGGVFCGLAVCHVNRCLYVADCSNSVVHRVELTGGNSTTKWPVEKSPEGLSVSISDNVLVAGYGTNKILEYTTQGKIVRQINLPSDIKKPVHAIQISENTFGVTHQSASRYSVVGSDGQVVMSSQAGEMDSPRGVAINKRGFVFTADEDNNRILVLHPQTLRSRQLPLSVALKGPMGLWLDASRDRLYIGESRGGRIIVVDKVNNLSFVN